VVEFLRRYLDMAEKGEIQSVVLGYIKTDGGANLQSTPISPIMMNHLHKLLERRVDREYDRAIAQAADSGRQTTGAQAVPEKPHQQAVPRKVRREVQQRVKNLQKLAAKKARKKQAAEEVIRTPAPAATNGQATPK